MPTIFPGIAPYFTKPVKQRTRPEDRRAATKKAENELLMKKRWMKLSGTLVIYVKITDEKFSIKFTDSHVCLYVLSDLFNVAPQVLFYTSIDSSMNVSVFKNNIKVKKK